MSSTSAPPTGLHRLLADHPRRVFWLFAALHAAVWTALPAQVHPNVPMDVIEGLAWGHEWQLGYFTHPPLQAWILEAYAGLTGGGIFSLYLLAQLGIVLCFWAVWRLAREMLSEQHAVLAVLLLEGIYYFNYESVDFNPNVLQLPLWALIALFLHRAIRRGGGYWLLLGVVSAVSVLAKYSTAFMLVPVLLFLVFNPEARKRLATPGPYAALVVFLAVMAPHLAWLVDNGFPSLSYGLGRAANDGAALGHLWQPLRFALVQALVLLPAGLMAAVLVARRPLARMRLPAWTFDHWFVFAMAMGPFLLHLAVSLVFGFKLRSMWGTPLWSLAGLFVLMIVPPVLTPARVRRFAALWIGLFLVAVLSYGAALTVGPYVAGKPSRGHFPGAAIAAAMTDGWHELFGRPLAVVSGPPWLAGNVAFYSDDRPSLYINADDTRSPWIDKAALRATGAVFVWLNPGAGPPAALLKRFPALRPQPALTFPWRRPAPLPAPGGGRFAPLPPVRVGWAVLPPAAAR